RSWSRTPTHSSRATRSPRGQDDEPAAESADLNQSAKSERSRPPLSQRQRRRPARETAIACTRCGAQRPREPFGVRRPKSDRDRDRSSLAWARFPDITVSKRSAILRRGWRVRLNRVVSGSYERQAARRTIEARRRRQTKVCRRDDI